MGEKVETDCIIGYTIHLESICKLQEPGKVHPCILILQAMELDRRCNQLNLAWFDLKVVRWNGRIEDDGTDVGNPWSVVILHDRTWQRWLMLNPICLGKLGFSPGSDSLGKPGEASHGVGLAHRPSRIPPQNRCSSGRRCALPS
ncbi:unnamed protein product [Linum trigynum]|uniref:Uncharacterized protein n=1 Tax=Linum trigynum TaxID=586398 RepID=A0AAV2GRK3_9ROSI